MLVFGHKSVSLSELLYFYQSADKMATFSLRLGKNRSRAGNPPRQINGDTYLFYPWQSGDVAIPGQRPWYYVLKKSDAPKVAGE